METFTFSETEEEKESVFGMNAAEKQYRERYTILRKMYEDRLHRLTDAVQDINSIVENDPVLERMKADTTTAPFVAARAQEIGMNTLASQREEEILEMMEVSSSQASHILMLEGDYENYRKQSSSKVHSLQDQATNLVNEIQSTTNSKVKLEAQVKDMKESLERDKMKTITQAHQLMVSIDKNSSKTLFNHDFSFSAIMSIVEDAVHSRHLQEEQQQQQTNMQIVEKYKRCEKELAGQVQALSSQLEILILENKEYKEQVESSNARVHMFKTKLEETHLSLAKSERERLELREQYVSIGNKLEQLVLTSDENARREVESMREKLHESEMKCAQQLQTGERLQRDLTNASIQLERKDNRVQELEFKLEQVQHEKIEKVESLKFLHQQQLETCNHKYALLSDRFDETKTELEKRVRDLQQHIQQTAENEKLDRQNQEKSRTNQIAEFQLKTEKQFQRLLDAKQQELDKVLQGKQAELAQSQNAADRVDKEVDLRTKALLKDHISLAQHTEILNSRLVQANEAVSKNSSMLHERHKQEQQQVVRAVEEKAQWAVREALERAEQRICHLQDLLQEEKNSKIRSQQEHEEECRQLAVFKHKFASSERLKNEMEKSLQQALGNMGRLKTMFNESKETVGELQKSLSRQRKEFQAEMEVARETHAFMEEQVKRFEISQNSVISDWSKKLDVAKMEMEATMQAKNAAEKLQESSFENLMKELELAKEQEIERKIHENDLLQVKLSTLQVKYDEQVSLFEAQIQQAKEGNANEKRINEELGVELQGFKQANWELESRLKTLETRKTELETQYNEEKLKVKGLEDIHGTEYRKWETKSTSSKKNYVKTLGTIFDATRSLRRSVGGISQEVRKSMDEFRQECQSASLEIHRSMTVSRTNSKRKYQESIAALKKSHKVAMSEQVKELDEISNTRITAIQTELNYMRNKLQMESEKSNQIFTIKESSEMSLKAQLDDASKHIIGLETKLEESQSRVEQSLQVIDELRVNVKNSRDESVASASAVALKCDEIAALEHQLDKRMTSFLSILVAIRSRIPFDEGILDRIVKDNEISRNGLRELYDGIDRVLKEIQNREVQSATRPISETIAALEDEKSSLLAQIATGAEEKYTILQQMQNLHSELEKKTSGSKATEIQCQNLESKYQDQSQKIQKLEAETRSQIESLETQHSKEIEFALRTLQENEDSAKQSMTARFQATLVALKESHARELSNINHEGKITEETLSRQLAKEKQRVAKLKDQLLSLNNSESLSSSFVSARPQTPKMDNEFERLMRRSTNLDSEAKQLYDETFHSRIPSPRSSSTFQNSPRRNTGSFFKPRDSPAFRREDL